MGIPTIFSADLHDFFRNPKTVKNFLDLLVLKTREMSSGRRKKMHREALDARITQQVISRFCWLLCYAISALARDLIFVLDVI